MKTKFKILISLLTFIIISNISLLAACNLFDSNGNQQLLTRNAINNDINVVFPKEVAFTITYRITPYVDINNLQITFEYLDENDSVLATKVKVVGNVTKNTEYSVSVSLSEFSLTEIYKMDSTTAKVTGGTVSLFE